MTPPDAHDLEFSLPTKTDKVPAGPDWIHEIKYDGYRMLVVREQDRASG
jgi:bifunctional non-homologous end joining protein LigD